MPSPVGHSLAGLIAYQIAPEIDGMARGQVTRVTDEALRVLDEGIGRGEEERCAVGSQLVVELQVGDRLLDRGNERRYPLPTIGSSARPARPIYARRPIQANA